MSRAREFWIDPKFELISTVKQEMKEPWLHVREVVPIDWEKVFVEFAKKSRGEIFDTDEKIIQELIEKAIKGEL